MNSHLIEFSTLLVLFTIAYHFLLRNNKNYTFLRIYCVTAILLAILFPFLPSILPTQIDLIATLLPTATITADGGQALISGTNELSQNRNYILITYTLVALALGARFLYSIIQIFQLITQSAKQNLFGTEILVSKNINEPCSIFNYILLPASNKYDAQTSKTIIHHESLHIQYGHTIEKLLLEIARIFLWFHPAIWYLKKELQLIHEYQVDAAMSAQTNIDNYKSTLIRLATTQNSLLLINPFASQIKKRITMMNSINTFKKSSYFLLACVLIGGSLFLHACQKETTKKEEIRSNFDKEKKTKNEAKAYEDWASSLEKPESGEYLSLETNIAVDTVIVFNPETYEEKMQIVRNLYERTALFPGCEEVKGFQEMIDCSNSKLLSYIYTNLVYPKAARDANKEGVVVTKLLIGKTGKLDDYKVLRSPDDSLSQAVEEVITKMKKEITWKPGIKDGDKEVNSEFILPIKFKLE